MFRAVCRNYSKSREILVLGVDKSGLSPNLPSIQALLDGSNFSGETGEHRLFYNVPAMKKNVLVLSTENKEKEASCPSHIDDKLQSSRMLAHKAVSTLKATFPKEELLISFRPLGDTKATSEGAHLAQFTFDHLKSKPKPKSSLSLFEGTKEEQSEWVLGSIMAEAQNHARFLAESPANLMTPKIFAEYAQSILEKDESLKLSIYEKSWIEGKGMNAFLSVSKGSTEDPYFLEIEYDGTNQSDSRPYALIGKGVTFDSGGISIKPSNNMADMKGDMSGAAVVLSTMWAIQKLKLPIKVVAGIPLTENMPSGNATRPSDVIKAMNGKTIEIGNTDAEGRMILADAIHYLCSKHKPRSCVELSTLTGAMFVALGTHMVGVFSSTASLYSSLELAGRTAGDPFWRMPMHPGYLKQMESRIADLSNDGVRGGGSCTAAAFLTQFVPNIQWSDQTAANKTAFAHVDIAGVMQGGDLISGKQDMSGRPTRSIIEYLIKESKICN